MSVVTSRADFEKLVDLRLEEAKNLIDHGNWDGAYYLADYAVEFALKVRIIANLMGSNTFPEKKFVDNFYKHDLAWLRKAADLDRLMDDDPVMLPSWRLVVKWSEQSRYTTGREEMDAKELFNEIANKVVPWIKARW